MSLLKLKLTLRVLLLSTTAIFFSASVFAAKADKEQVSLSTYQNIPVGWKTEVIPFPLDYAPEIAYQGLEELVFLPGMYKADDEQFFSFAFSWKIDTEVEYLNISQLKQDLTAYYVGLNKAVTKANSAEVDVDIKPVRDGKWQYQGTINWQEPFITKKPQTINFKALSQYCLSQQQQRWYFIASPQSAEHIVWQQLSALDFTVCE